MIEFLDEHPLPPEWNKSFICFAYDKEHTFLGTNDKHIYVLDGNNSYLEHIGTQRQYHTFCYDFSLGCFFAASPGMPGVIFRLSGQFEEQEQITLAGEEPFVGMVNHLFYDSEDKKLLFSYKSRIYSTDYKGNVLQISQSSVFERMPGAICAAPGNYLCLFNSRQRVRLLAISKSDYKAALDYQLFPEAMVRAMITLPDTQPLKFRLLVQRNNNTYYMMDYELNSLAHSVTPPPRLNSGNLSELHIPPCRCNPFDPCHDPCHNPCDNPCCDPCCDWCSSGCCRQALADLIESIALGEASLAHILNAEGEKLQKAIQSTSSIPELLKVNESVQKTIIHCTHLEQILFNKLEAIVNFDFCDCHDCMTPCTRDEEA